MVAHVNYKSWTTKKLNRILKRLNKRLKVAKSPAQEDCIFASLVFGNKPAIPEASGDDFEKLMLKHQIIPPGHFQAIPTEREGDIFDPAIVERMSYNLGERVLTIDGIAIPHIIINPRRLGSHFMIFPQRKPEEDIFRECIIDTWSLMNGPYDGKPLLKLPRGHSYKTGGFPIMEDMKKMWLIDENERVVANDSVMVDTRAWYPNGITYEVEYCKNYCAVITKDKVSKKPHFFVVSLRKKERIVRFTEKSEKSTRLNMTPFLKLKKLNSILLSSEHFLYLWLFWKNKASKHLAIDWKESLNIKDNCFVNMNVFWIEQDILRIALRINVRQ